MEDQDLEILERALSNLEATEAKSDFEGLYKNWGNTGSQEERRQELLDIQKRNRNNKVDKFRGILDIVNTVEGNNQIFKPQNRAEYRPNIYVAGFHKTCLTYSNVLMLSEWMIEKPSDFAENWYIVPCPKGIRVLVVSNNGNTKFYTKYGHFKFDCYTGLPGGNPHNCYRKNCCVLDGFYCEPTNTLYVLDLLAWNNQPMTDGETEFRHYWMRTQLEDFPDTTVINKKNKVIFKLLAMMPCTTHYLNIFLGTFPQFRNNTPPLDGLLFYHKRAHYVAGETPLVLWLYPYMVPEIIGEEIEIHPIYEALKPADYVNQAEFIKKFSSQQKKPRRRPSAMDEDQIVSKKDVSKKGEGKKSTYKVNVEENVDMESEVDNNKSDAEKTNRSLPEGTKDAAQSLEMDADGEKKPNE